MNELTHVSTPTGIKGVLLVNLGTPDSYAVSDVRKYLREFLSDPRVLDINPVARFILVNAVIAPFRAARSAKSYKAIWTDKGSPLMANGVELRNRLAHALGAEFQIELAMRYQSPSIEDALEKLRRNGIDAITVIPLFPHYASASTGSVQEKVMSIVSRWPVVPEIFFKKSYHDDPEMIATFVAHGKKYDVESFDHVLFSFHGLPIRQLKKADPCGDYCKADGLCCLSLNLCNRNCYAAQCYDTAKLLAQNLGLKADCYTVCFQSRLGSDPWVPPYTSEVITKLAKEGVKRVLVFCPAFVSDCLETLFEVTVEYQEDFKALGGELLQLVESLNDDPAWVKAVERMVRTAGQPTG